MSVADQNSLKSRFSPAAQEQWDALVAEMVGKTVVQGNRRKFVETVETAENLMPSLIGQVLGEAAHQRGKEIYEDEYGDHVITSVRGVISLE